MIVIPAIDLKDGRVIRLHKGEFSKVTEYSADPIEMAMNWQKQGAKIIHIVDLDGAQSGSMKNFDIIREMAHSLNVPIQVGGGIRSERVIDELLSRGIARVILGTVAVDNRAFVKTAISKYGEKIAVSIDCKDGFMTQEGWTVKTTVKGTDFAQDLEAMGLQVLIYTDVDRDGTLAGPNIASLQEMMNAVSIPVIASGGVSNIDDIKALQKLDQDGLLGVITGKALYEGSLNLEEAIRVCSINE